MPTDIPDFDGVRRSIENPLAPGRAAAAASKPVALDNESKAVLDTVATQTTLAAVLAKIIAAPATEATVAAMLTALQIIDDWDESDRAKVNLIAGQAGITAGAGAVAANTPRMTHASDDPLITAINAGRGYEIVLASQTNAALGATGAAGDYLDGIQITVNTAATCAVSIKDGSNTAYPVFPNNPGAGIGVYPVALGGVSTSGAWQITTGAGCTVIAFGQFT